MRGVFDQRPGYYSAGPEHMMPHGVRGMMPMGGMSRPPAGYFQPPNPDDMPPSSRVFVNCPATLTKEIVQQQFETCGPVQNIRMVTDHSTGKFKGLCFVKFEKSSSAALAVERLNGTQLSPTDSPIKVVYADPKGAARNTHDDGEVPPRSRLIATFFRDLTEEEVRPRFEAFGDLEYVKVLKNKQTNQNKGVAFVKYSKTSTALRAMEDITEQETNTPSPNQPMRVRVADPRPPLSSGLHIDPYSYAAQSHMIPPYMMPHMHQQHPMMPHMAPHSFFTGSVDPFHQMWKNPMFSGNKQRIDNNVPPGSRLFISFSKQLPIDYLQQLFVVYGQLESIFLMKGKNCGYAKYSTAQAAQAAAAALNGMEVYEGVIAKVVIASPQVQGMPRKNY